MLRILARDLAVKLYGLTAQLGLHSSPSFNRLFLASYAIYKKYFEVGPIDQLREFVPGGSLVIDVGANVGFFSLRFAKWVGSDGMVISIEPEENNYNSLVSALAREDFLNRVRLFKAVAAAEDGTAFLEINPLHPADHKLSRDGTGLSVASVRLDDLVQENGALRPSLVKIDVQGAEMLVLMGAARILKNVGPALFIELDEAGLNRFGSSVSAVLDHLSDQGYAAYWLMRSGEHKRASSAEIHAKAARIGYVDVLFLKARNCSQ